MSIAAELVAPRIRDTTRQALRVGAYLVTYVGVDWATYVYPVVPLGITPWNPPTGLSLFFLLTVGINRWPALFVAAFAADVIVRGAFASFEVLAAAAAIITAGYTLAAWMLRRWLRSASPFESTHDLVVFLGVVLVSTLAVACAFVSFYSAIGMVSRDDLVPHILKYWVGDLNGILTVIPALFCLTQIGRLPRGFRWLVRVEVALQLAALLVSLALVFQFAGEYPSQSFYVLFLPLIWISARWGLPGAAIAQMLIQLGLIVGVQVEDYHSATFVQLQLLMAGLCVTGLTLGAVSSHRARLELALQEKQAALSRVQQLASAGELTSALAHQLNQPMTALNSYVGACQLLVEQSQVDLPRLQQLMDKVAGEALRASKVVTRLRDFYQQGVTDPQPVQAAALLDNVVPIVRRQAQALGVEIAVRTGELSRVLVVDAVQIENALQNVLQNAVDAVAACAPDRRRIEVTIEHDAERVSLRVRDTGPGVPGDTGQALFEPFNTSKASGMGMGLAIARSLVRANAGELALESSGPAGTVFVMHLPVTLPNRESPA